MGGSQTHADNNMAFFVKSSTTLFVNRIPVLLVCRFRRKPTSTLFALRALYLLMEVHANVGILIASAPISHHPLFARNLNIRYVDLSHTLHRESVEVKINLFIFNGTMANLAIEILALGRGQSTSAFSLLPPQNTLTNLWREI